MKSLEHLNKGSATPTAPIQSLQSFVLGMGISPVTAWRFEKRGWLNTVNIAGRRYITSEAAADFVRRAQAGEFAKQHPTPKRVEAL